MRVCVGSPGTFSTRKWRSATLAICGRCVIVSTCARSASRRSVAATAWAVTPPIPASISSKTSVSPPATAASASAIRESSPPEAVSATGRERQAGVRADEEDGLVGPGRPELALAQLDEELALAHAQRASSAATASAKRRRRSRRAVAQLGGERGHACLGLCDSACRRGSTGSWPVGERRRAPPGGARRVRAARRSERASKRRLSSAIRSSSLSTSSSAPGSASSEARKRRRSLPTSRRRSSTSRSSSPARELGREPLERRQRALGARGERPPRPLRPPARSALSAPPPPRPSSLDVTQPLALRAELVLVARRRALRFPRRALELREPSRDGVGVARQLLVAPARSCELPPRRRASRRRSSCSSRRTRRARRAGTRAARAGAARTGPTSRSGARLPRPRPPARPPGPMHRRACDRRRRPAARARDPPRLRGAAPRARRRSSSSKKPSGTSSSASTYASVAVRPTERRVARAPEQQPDRLREDRLPGARLAGDRVQPGRKVELGLADEDEVLDPEPTEHPRHRPDCDGTSATVALGGASADAEDLAA